MLSETSKHPKHVKYPFKIYSIFYLNILENANIVLKSFSDYLSYIEINGQYTDIWVICDKYFSKILSNRLTLEVQPCNNTNTLKFYSYNL